MRPHHEVNSTCALHFRNAGHRAFARESGVRRSCGFGLLAGSTAPGRLGPAAPHGGRPPLGRRPSFPHWGRLSFLPQSLALAPGLGPYLVPGHGCDSSGLSTVGKSDKSAPSPGGSAAPPDTCPSTAQGSCISERGRYPALPTNVGSARAQNSPRRRREQEPTVRASCGASY
jgi:hypothetical protein